MDATPVEADSLRVIGARLLTLIQRVFACEMVSMALLDPATGQMQPLATRGLAPDVERQWWSDVPQMTLQTYFAPDIVATLYAGQAVEVDLHQRPFLNRRDYHLHRILVAPLLLGATVVGVMSIEYQDASRSFAKSDRELLLAMGRLSALALERDRLLHEQAMAEARELALQEASQRMNEFLGIASHELRTPLTSIIANVQMSERALQTLMAEMVDATTQRQIAKLHVMVQRSNQQLLRLNRLVGDLLDISRISAGKLELRPEPCDMLALVRECVETQRATVPERQIILDLPRQNTLRVQGDADRLGQVLTNYLTNALKYAPPSETITVMVRQQSGQVRVAVRDQGPGLSAAQQEHLFERFYRVPGIEQYGSGVGLGLGLYICKTIIERHGGTLGVTSRKGHGAPFWFALPLLHATQA